MTIGLYFGSFNPIHIGHLAIANYMVEFGNMDQLWFVVSPQNPLKNKVSLLEDYHRYELVFRAVEDDSRFRASNIEFSLPKPSYTIDTLTYLKEKYPKNKFVLIMGADNYTTIDKWKNYTEILDNYKIVVYPRKGIIIKDFIHSNVFISDAPLMEISSSFIREAIKNGKDIRYFVPEKAWKYIDEMNFYRTKPINT
ncbi:MAG: nicotinic acid mononucleotide adenylyltransferase [Bacteroidetes bacterium GWF2_38_335]|nr:MAG: nicotinic acid mononucleotide adenylyltransferase [Bacteroidetes bacterium GWF2_38_335]HBS88004.1 nicotinic acid mononucleotide adenylyltransferase [Bacteroidales bacterium]